MSNTVDFNIRVPEEMNDKLIEIAKREERSKNAQIVYIIKTYIEQYENKIDLPLV